MKFVDNDANDYKFTGKKRDLETGLDYFGARYYSNGLGRWVSADWSPKPVPVPYAVLGDPQSLNLYGFVGGNPASKTDPDGHKCYYCKPPVVPQEVRDFAQQTFTVENFKRAVNGLVDDAVDLLKQATTPPHSDTPAGFVPNCTCGPQPAPIPMEEENQNNNNASQQSSTKNPSGQAKQGGTGRAPSKIDRAAFKSEREAFWKAEAKANPEKYSAADLAKMEKGKPPTGSDGHPMELHHADRTQTGPLEPMTRTEHRLGENFKKNHPE